MGCLCSLWGATVLGFGLLFGQPANAQVTNGGFERPFGINPYHVFVAGDVLSGWVVERGTVEIVGTYWQAAEGTQSLDLNGIWEDTGTIYQDLHTVPGQEYQIRFALAGNPEGGPAIKVVKVFWENNELAALSFDTTGRSFTDMGWQYHQFTVIATGDSSRLRFQSGSPSFCGPVLDDITTSPETMTPVPPTNPPVIIPPLPPIPPPYEPPPVPSQPGVFTNGGFEQPEGISSYRVFGTGASLPGWVVERGTVEIVGSYWQAAEGTQSLDLNGIFEEIGTIYQDATTVAGQQYRVSFAYAGNPDGGPNLKTAMVFWNETKLADLSFDITGHTREDLGWTNYSFLVTATGTVSRLRFQSTTTSFCGPTLDAINIQPVSAEPPNPDGDSVAKRKGLPGIHLGVGKTPWLTIQGTVGSEYRIERADGSLSGPWETVATVVLTDTTYVWHDQPATNTSHRFYRSVLVK